MYSTPKLQGKFQEEKLGLVIYIAQSYCSDLFRKLIYTDSMLLQIQWQRLADLRFNVLK